MRRKIWAMILCAVMLLALAAGFAGCSDGNSAEGADAVSSEETGGVYEEEAEGIAKYFGSWTATKVKTEGSDTAQPVGELLDGEFTIKFEEGFCDYTIQNMSFKHTQWELVDDRIKIHDHRDFIIYMDDNGDGTLSTEYDKGTVLILERND